MAARWLANSGLRSYRASQGFGRNIGDFGLRPVRPHQDLEREVDSRQRHGHHNRRAGGGLPNKTSVVSRNSRPTRRASALWSITAKRRYSLGRQDVRNRVTVLLTDRGLSLVTTSPSSCALEPDIPTSSWTCLG